MEFKYRYDLIIEFNHTISEHFYSGDDFIGGLNEEKVLEVIEQKGESGITFFPDLLNDLDSLFGDEDFESSRCDISVNNITLYYSTNEQGIQNFEKKCIGWVLIKDLDKAFNYYCIIDFKEKEFIIRDADGAERRDKLKTISIKDGAVLN